MTVSTLTRRIEFNGTASLTYAYPFRIFTSADLLVTVDDVLQVLSVDYSVTGAGDVGGGNVVFVNSVDTLTVKIQRRLDATQETDYVAGDSFPAESHEDALDKLTMLVQERGIAQCERFGATTPTAASASATADTVYTWPDPFADDDYTAFATGVGATGIPILSIESWTSTTVTVRVTAASDGAAGFDFVHIQAVHD